MKSLSVLNEAYNRYYRNGMDAFENKNYEVARRNILKASEALLMIAKQSDKGLKEQRIKTAERLIVFSTSIEENFLKEKKVTIKENINDHNQLEDDDKNTKEKFVTKVNLGIKLDDVKGLEEVKKEIDKLIVGPMKHPELYELFNKNKGGGILLYGVPGTGKTMIAQAIASEIEATFFAVKSSDLNSKYFGDSEKNIKALFDEAKKHERAIIFFDEFEAIGSSRDIGTESPMKRIVPEILNQMQGFDKHEKTLIFIAATNRPWDIDSAFLRAGRLGIQIHVPIPDYKARKEILLSNLKNTPKDDDLDIDYAIEKTQGFNGSDVFAFSENIKQEAIDRSKHKMGPLKITNEDLKNALKHSRSTVRRQDLENIIKYQKEHNLLNYNNKSEDE